MLAKRQFAKLLIPNLALAAILSVSQPVRAEEDFNQMITMLNLMGQFLDIMDSVYAMNSDPEKAALMQMHEIEEIYKSRGQHQRAIAVYKDILKTSKNPTIRNLAYIRMADVMKEAGDADAAVNVLSQALNESLQRVK